MQRYKDAKGFFHMSSSSIYAMKDDSKAPVSEEDELGGYSSYWPHYAMSKQSTEAVVRFMARLLNLPTIIARLDVAYGQYSHGGAPMLLVEYMRDGLPYYRARSGDSYCSPIYEDVIVMQVQGLLEHAAVPAPIINLSGDEVTSKEEIIEYLESLTGLKARIESRELATWGMTVLDCSKRKAMAGACTVSWKEGIRIALQARHPELLADK
jgi:nucleoside-diphosphate-sugar epimerase